MGKWLFAAVGKLRRVVCVCALIIWSLRVACRGAKLKEVVRLSEPESNAISLLL
jgi:hypothetical protein